MYDVDGVRSLFGKHTTSKKSYIYARVSSSKQRADLDRQVEDLQKAFPGHLVVKDIASGVNFKRKGLQTILEQVILGVVEEVC
jgi:predicted site-specific integrase-resolvase